MGLFKPTCVASFGFARQLLLQLGVVVVGAVVVLVPVYARILTQLRKDPTYRSFARVKASITDFYKGDFGQEVFTRLGKIFHLVDVQWPLLAYKALCAFRCDADGYLTSSPSERCRVQNYARRRVLARVCGPSPHYTGDHSPAGVRAARRRPRTARAGPVWLVTRAVSLSCDAAETPSTRHSLAQVVSGPAPRPPRLAKCQKGILFAAGCSCGSNRGPGHSALRRDLDSGGGRPCQNTFRPYLGWRLNALESLGCYAAVAACALGVLGIDGDSRYATARALDGLVILCVLLSVLRVGLTRSTSIASPGKRPLVSSPSRV